MVWSQAVLAVLALACAIVVVRGRTTNVVAPHDRKVFESRYGGRGMKVLAIRRVGTQWNHFRPFGRARPIRQYEIELEGPDGRRHIRRRGISRGDWKGDHLWRLEGPGGPERLA